MIFIKGFWLILSLLLIMITIFINKYVFISVICFLMVLTTVTILLQCMVSSVDDIWFNQFYVRSMGIVITNVVGENTDYITVVAYTFFNIPLYLNNYIEKREKSLFKPIENKESYLEDTFFNIDSAKKFIENNKYYFKPAQNIIFVKHNLFEHERIC
jgi:hypothetical protein